MFVHTHTTIFNSFKQHCELKNATLIDVTKFDGSDRSEATVKCNFCSSTRDNYLLRQARNKKATSVCNNSKCISERRSIKQRLSEEELEFRINESLCRKNVQANPSKPFLYKNFISLQHTKFSGICGICGNEVTPLLNNLLDNNSGCCDNCSISGFNKNIIGYLYIISIYDNLNGELNAIKVGITNNLNQRYNNQTSKSMLDKKILCNVWEGSGKDIYDVEKFIKKYFKNENSYLTKTEYPDGYTETYCDILHRDIVEFIRAWMEHINSTIDINSDDSVMVYEYVPDEIKEEFNFEMIQYSYE